MRRMREQLVQQAMKVTDREGGEKENPKPAELSYKTRPQEVAEVGTTEGEAGCGKRKETDRQTTHPKLCAAQLVDGHLQGKERWRI